jgi:hypothetical protein
MMRGFKLSGFFANYAPFAIVLSAQRTPPLPSTQRTTRACHQASQRDQCLLGIYSRGLLLALPLLYNIIVIRLRSGSRETTFKVALGQRLNALCSCVDAIHLGLMH